MITKFCNGGTLADFCDEFALGDRPYKDLTDSILLHIMAEQLETISFLYGCSPSLGHVDSHMNNIFLDFPEGSKFPNFYTGDLGQLKKIDERIWETTKAGQIRRIKNADVIRSIPKYKYSVKYIQSDLEHVQSNLEHLSCYMPSDGESPGEYSDDPPKIWSWEFLECQDLLDEIIENIHVPSKAGGGHKPNYLQFRPRAEPDYDITAYNKLGELMRKVRKCAEEARASDAEDVDFSWAKNTTKRPVLWLDRDMLLSECKQEGMPGPFKIARIDPATLAVLEIEAIEYGASNPRELDDDRGPFNAGDFPDTDFFPDPLLGVQKYSFSNDWSDLDITLEDEYVFEVNQDTGSDSERDPDEDPDSYMEGERCERKHPWEKEKRGPVEVDLDSHPDCRSIIKTAPVLKEGRSCHALYACYCDGPTKFQWRLVERLKDGSFVVRVDNEDFIFTKWKRDFDNNDGDIVMSEEPVGQPPHPCPPAQASGHPIEKTKQWHRPNGRLQRIVE